MTTSSPPTRTDVPERTALGDMVRMLDVATALRKERARAERELDREECRQRLRERLLASAEVTGDPVSAAEVDAAIEQYFDQRHAYRAPKLGWTRVPARWWVRRSGKKAFGLALLTLAGALGIAFAAGWL